MTTRSSTAMLAAPRVSSLFITNLHLLTVGLRSAYQPDVQRGLAVGTASWYLSNIMCPLQGKLKGDCGAHGHGQGKAPVSKRVAAPLSWPSQLGSNLGRTRLPPCSAKAAWARSIVPATRS